MSFREKIILFHMSQFQLLIRQLRILIYLKKKSFLSLNNQKQRFKMYTAFREIHLVLSYDFLLLIFIHILLQIFQDTEFYGFLIFYLCTVIDFFAPCLSILHTYVVAILAKLIKTFNETSLDIICIKYIHPVPPPPSLSLSSF